MNQFTTVIAVATKPLLYRIIKLIEFNKRTVKSLTLVEIFFVTNFMVFDFPWQWELVKSWYEKFH